MDAATLDVDPRRVDALLRQVDDLDAEDRAHQNRPPRRPGIYQSGPGPWNHARAERERTRRALGLVRVHARALGTVDEVDDRDRGVGHHFVRLVEGEVARAGVPGHERPRVAEAALGFVHHLREHGLGDPCDEVVARAGVELAVDHELRLDVRVDLDQEDPTRWWWSSPGTRWTRQKWNGPDDFVSPVVGIEIPELRRHASVFATGFLERTLVEPAWPWDSNDPPQKGLVDPLRLPILGIRWAADAITRLLGRVPRHVVAIETGKAISAQALSAWLPFSIIHAVPSVGLLGHPDPAVSGQVGAVVLGLPRVGAVHYVYMMTSFEGVLTGEDHEDLLRHGGTFRSDDATVVAVVDATKLIRPGGVLVTFADCVEQAVAVRVLRGLRFEPVGFDSAVDTATRPIWSTWLDNPPARPAQVLGPTDRLLSVWRAP